MTTEFAVWEENQTLRKLVAEGVAMIERHHEEAHWWCQFKDCAAVECRWARAAAAILRETTT
jgi:hypothetical protein